MSVFRQVIAPIISSFTPTSAATGTTVTITGTNFTDASAVSFGGTAATSYNVASATSITSVVASGTTGTISVTTPGGTATSSEPFTYIPVPTITSFTPTSAAPLTIVTITGTGFIGASAVSFGGTAATSYSVVSATSITAVVAGGASGSVSVTTPGGTATRIGFTFIDAPSAQPTNLNFSNTKTGSNYNIVVNYTASASADGYLVVRKAGSAPAFVPVDGTTYSAGTQGSDQIVYAGSAVTCTDATVTAGTVYNYAVYAYKGSGSSIAYLTTNPLSGNSAVYSTSPGAVASSGSASASAGFPNAGVNVTFPGGTTGTTLTVTKTAAAPASNFSVLSGVRGVKNLYFTITSSNATPGNYTLVMDFSDLGLTLGQWANFKVLKRADASSPWVDITTVGGTIVSRQTDGVLGKFTITELSSFSEFALGESFDGLIVNNLVEDITSQFEGIPTRINAQTFTTNGTRYDLTSATLSITNTNTPLNAVLKLYGALPNGEIDFSGGVLVTFSVPTLVSGENYKFTPLSPATYTLQANTTYWLVFNSTTSSYFNYTSSTIYTGVGTLPLTNNNNSWDSGTSSYSYFPDSPFMFEVEGNVIPTPNTWNGSVGTDWITTDNWDLKSVPFAENIVVIPGTVTNFPVVNEAPATPAECSHLTINAGGKLTITAGKALNVNGNLVNSAGTTGLVINSDATGTGSLKIMGSVSGGATVERYMALDSWHLISSPTGLQTISDFITNNKAIPILAPADLDFGLRDYMTEGTSNWNPYFTTPFVATNTTQKMEVGKGYLIRSVNTENPLTQTIKFEAVLNSRGDQAITVTRTETNGWNCIGNPYTSAIKIYDATETIEPDNFINANNGNFDPDFYGAYFWNDAVGQKKYDIINKSSGVIYAQVGQGFFIRKKDDVAVTAMSVTPAMQFHQGAISLKSGTVSHPTIQLIATSGDLKSSTDIKFIEGTSKGLDVGYDAGILKADPSFALYTKLVEPYDAEFQLQCLPSNQYNNLVIPIGLDSKAAGEIVLSVNTVQLAQDCKVILEDKLTNTFTDLSKGSYKAVIAANTTGAGRFYLHTGDFVSGVEDQVLPGKLTAYARGNKEIRVIGEVGEGAVATLVNGLGQVALTKKLGSGNLNIIGLPNLNSGVYLLNINDKGTPQTIKVMVRK